MHETLALRAVARDIGASFDSTQWTTRSSTAKHARAVRHHGLCADDRYVPSTTKPAHFGATIDVAFPAHHGRRRALANHGNVVVAATLEKALHLAISMEACARVYVQALAIGEPVALPEDAQRAGAVLFRERR